MELKLCQCGATCVLFEVNENEPCYGQVDAVDENWDGEDWYWTHSCDGHEDIFFRQGPYKKKSD